MYLIRVAKVYERMGRDPRSATPTERTGTYFFRARAGDEKSTDASRVIVVVARRDQQLHARRAKKTIRPRQMSPSSRRDAPRRASPRVSRGPRVDVRLGPRARASLASSARLARAARLLGAPGRRARPREGATRSTGWCARSPRAPRLHARLRAPRGPGRLLARARACASGRTASASSRTPPRTTGARTSCTATPPGSPSRWIASRATFLARWTSPPCAGKPRASSASPRNTSPRSSFPSAGPSPTSTSPRSSRRSPVCCSATSARAPKPSRCCAEFPLVDAVAVVETEPGVLAEECDVRARIERLREARANGRLSPSAEMFYDGEGLGCANPALFAKVFLEESRSKAEAYECDQRCG